MKIRLANPIQEDSIVDGEGLRAVIWTQGCLHNCEECHNPTTHDLNGGYTIELEELKEQIKALENQDGITLSGGDPFFQPEACSELLEYIKALNINVWAYTGYTFEALLKLAEKNYHIQKMLNHIDVLIDGKFIPNQKSLDVKYRGSTNQRVIDVQESLINKRITIRKGY